MDVLNIVFAGTPAFAAQHLQALLDSPHRIVAVYTQPDRPAGRGKHLQASPVKSLAEQHQLPVLQPSSLRDPQEQQRLEALQPDLLIVVAYGLILPQAILDIPRNGCINVHASLLPRWRGAAPIERALLAGDSETGITIMQMDAGLDTGAMLHRRSCPIAADDDRLSLESKLAACGREALLETLAELPIRQAGAEAQDEALACYARKLEKSEALIDWSDSATQIHRQIRAAAGRAAAYSFLGKERIRILQAAVLQQSSSAAPGCILAADAQGLQVACGDATLLVQRLQLPGKNPVAIRDVLNARRDLLAPGSRFSTEPENESR